MSLYLAAYDIRHGGRRASVARILLTYGHRVQQSVYELWLSPEEVPDLRREVGAHLSRDDLFDLVPIDERGSRTRYSWQREPKSWDAVVLL